MEILTLLKVKKPAPTGKRLPLPVLQIYLPDATDEAPSIFSAILAKPRSWDLLQISAEEYIQSPRTKFECQDDAWHVQDLTPV